MKHITPEGKRLIKKHYNKVIKDAEKKRDKLLADVREGMSE